MPIISLSLLSMVKGAIFLSKSAAVIAFIVKNGALIIGKLGVDGTITAAATTAAITGTAIGIASIPKNTKEGFNKMIKGMGSRSAADFFEGLAQVSAAYTTVTGFIGDFFDYVDSLDVTNDVKIEIKNSVEDMSSLLKCEIEKRSIELLREFETILRDRGLSNTEYISKINSIYEIHTDDIYDDYDIVLGRGGRIYADICELNKKHGLRDGNEYDHYLVYCIAGWILDHIRTLDCLLGISQKKLAHDITDNILYYLHSIGKA